MPSVNTIKKEANNDPNMYIPKEDINIRTPTKNMQILIPRSKTNFWVKKLPRMTPMLRKNVRAKYC